MIEVRYLAPLLRVQAECTGAANHDEAMYIEMYAKLKNGKCERYSEYPCCHIWNQEKLRF